MNRLTAIALPLALLAGPVLAQAPVAQTAPPPVAVTPVAMPKVPRPSDLGCMIRMMDLYLMTRKGAEDQARSAEDRGRATALSAQANTATAYYAGRLGPAFSKSNNFAAGEAEFKKLRANTRDVSAAEMAMCLSEAETGQRAVLQSMAAPKTPAQ